MHLNFTANSFIFGRKNRDNAPRTVSAKFAGRELPKCVSTSWSTASFLYAKIVIMRPELFLYTSQDENFQNASELRRKQLHIWTHKS